MDNQPFVSVIIPTYNRAEMLPKTLTSFLDQTYPRDRYEIIVADNHSTDHTARVIESYRTPSGHVRSIFESRQGVHFARNSGAKASRGEILYFTDDDMIADQNLLREIVKVFAMDGNIGCATGRILGRFDVEPPPWVRRHLINACLSLTDPRIKEEIIIDASEDIVFSCHQAIRREAFFQAGGFNPENTDGVWLGEGETGLNLKLKKLGYTFAFTARSIIHHLIPKNRMTLAYLIKRFGNQGFCDAYTDYRRHRRRGRIIPLMIKRNILDMVLVFGLTAIKIFLRKRSWHFLPAYVAYYRNRNLYDWRLYQDESFRKMVEIDDWLNADAPLVLTDRKPGTQNDDL